MAQTRLFYPTYNIALGQKFSANNKSVHRLQGNRWDIKRLFVMTFIIVSYRRCVRSCRHSAHTDCAVVHLSDLLISVSFKIDDDTLEPCLYEQ